MNLNLATPSFFLSNVCHITNKVDELSGVISVNFFDDQGENMRDIVLEWEWF